ncbi:MAG: hypothetical protein QXP45_04015 [Thermoproteota archaeon]
MAPKSVSVWLAGLKRLFASNGIRIEERVRLKGYIINESVLPSTDLLRSVVGSADIRAKTAILIMASSSLRISELFNLKDVDLNSSPVIIRVKGIGAKESREVKVLAILEYMFHGSCRKVSKILSLALEQ